MKLFPALNNSLADLVQSDIPLSRQEALQPLVDFIQLKIDESENVLINFICTHNSRRSHLAQIWAQAAACFYDVPKVACYSAGTEQTAVYPLVLDTLIRAGFEVDKTTKGDNPVYHIRYGRKESPVVAFSKKLDHSLNPKTAFAAVMTCTEADGECPYISGAEVRLPLTYEDPKLYDHTDRQQQKYFERSLQIAREMKYVFSKIKR